MNKALAVVVLVLGAFVLGFATNNSSDSPSGAFLGPRIIAKVNLTDQTTQIPTTMLFTPPTSGLFRVSVYMTMTSPGIGIGQWAFHLNWTDDAGAEEANLGNILDTAAPPFAYCVSAAGAPPCGTTFNAKAGIPVTFYVDGDNGGGPFELFLVVERLE